MPAAVIESPASLPRRLLRIGDNVWAIADQMLISGTNFVTMILMARGLASAAEFGVFVLVYSILLFCNSLQTALVTQPHNVLGVTRQGKDYLRYTSTTAINQLALAGGLSCLVAVAWMVATASGWQSASMLLAMSLTIVAWQMQEFLRRVLYTERRTLAALTVDGLAYGGQTLAISYFWWTQRLTGTTALLLIAVTSSIAAVVGLWLLRRSLSVQYDMQVTRENWHFGKWLAASYLVGNWLSSQLLVFLAAGLLGTWAAGVLRAIHTVFGPMRIVAQAFSLTLPTKLAHTLEQEGKEGFRREVRRAVLTATPLFGAYCLLVLLLSGHILRWSFGKSYDGYTGVLVLATLSAFVGYLAIILAAVLRATRNTRYIFRCELCATLVVVPLTAGLIPLLGIYGVVLGMICTDLLLVGLLRWTYLHILTTAAPTGGKAADDQDMAAEPADGQRTDMLQSVLAVLERRGISYCVQHGYESYPEHVPSDVDCFVSRDFLAAAAPHGLPGLLGELAAQGLTPVQWFRGGAHGIVLQAQGASRPLVFLQLDLSDGCHWNRRVPFYSDTEILASRRRYRNFWIPAADIEFACTLIRRLLKRCLTNSHARRLSQLWRENPAGGREQLQRWFSTADVELIAEAATSEQWQTVRGQLQRLRRTLLLRAIARQPMRVVVNGWCGAVRRLRRLEQPRGYHLLLLGPDGAGKSTVAEELQRQLSGAFLGTAKCSFPPRLLNRPEGTPGQPHAVRPRSPLASAVRAVAYWWVYYGPGYYATVYPALVRGKLVIHDRHLVDCQIDPVRYRYRGPQKLLSVIWRLTPKPHLSVVLDVPPEILQARKQEVPFEVSSRQRQAYLQLARQLPGSLVVDGGLPLEQVVEQIAQRITGDLADRLQPRWQGKRG